MKKLLLLFVLLILISLSSCSINHIEDTNGEEDYSLCHFKKEDVFTYKSVIKVGSSTKSYNDKFSVSCKKLSGNYLIKELDSDNNHYSFTIDYKLYSGNAYFVLIKGDKIVQEIIPNKITTIHTDGGYEKIQLRLLGESCEFEMDIVYGISD